MKRQAPQPKEMKRLDERRSLTACVIKGEQTRLTGDVSIDGRKSPQGDEIEKIYLG